MTKIFRPLNVKGQQRPFTLEQSVRTLTVEELKKLLAIRISPYTRCP